MNAITRFSRVFVTIFAFSVSLASILFMAYVFYNEAFLSRGVLFIEPNLAMARFEFCMASVGFAWTLFLFYWFIGRLEK